MKKIILLVLVMFSFSQANSIVADYSKMSANELDEALVIAVKQGSYDQVQKLVKSGAQVNQKITYTKSNYDDYDSNITCTLLAYAVEHGYLAIVKEFIPKLKKDDLNTALILAAREGHTDIVKELASKKPHIDALNTALMYSVQILSHRTSRDYLNAVRELIKAGANVNYADNHGNTALISIIDFTKPKQKHRVEIIQALVKAKANVNYANKRSETALIRAIQQHDFDVVQIILNAPRININYANNNGDTALITAVLSLRYTYADGNNAQYNECLDSQKILEKLLQTPGINPHHVNKKGDTAIKLLEKAKSRLQYECPWVR